MERRFYTLDVFTTTRFEGNPLAVITDGDGLTDDAMLAIAREMNLSETVFVQKPTEDNALARLRIFTTREELKLAGHPVIGTWFLLAELGVVPAQEGGVHILQQTGAGVLPVEIRFKEGRPQRVTMTQKVATFRPAKINKKALAAALGLAAKDLDPQLEPEFVSTGISNLMLPLRNRAALAKISMNMIDLRKLLGNNGAMAYCFTSGVNGKIFSRGMLPWEQYEDAATGSAAGSLGAYLVRHGKLSAGHTLSILQGEEMGRPSHIEVEVTKSGKKLVPRVSGAAVKVFEGTIDA
ncbi:MAG: PhzF family phenazine biosynthesis protein [Candidatus Acidiferrum sp.]|jgi:trans-2,3-dihydro-3-hydroxyanthranilate isomerase